MADQQTLHQATAEGNLEGVRQLLDDGEVVDQSKEIPEASSFRMEDLRKERVQEWRRLTAEETDRQTE